MPPGYITLYYCCSCGMGPFNEEVFSACTNCTHWFCELCPTTFTSKSADPYQSSCNDASASSIETRQGHTNQQVDRDTSDHDLHRAVIGFVQPLSAPPASSAQRPPALSQTSSHNHIEDHGSQLLPTTSYPATPAYPTVNAPPEAVDGDMVWFCHCGDGPFLVELYPSCMSCGHQRCATCSYQET